MRAPWCSYRGVAFGEVLLSPGVSDEGDDVLVLPNGRIIAAGASDGGLVLARLLPSGKLDSSFGKEGSARVPKFGIEVSQSTQVVRDGKGRLLVGLNEGTAEGMSSEGFPGVARFLPGGKLDRTFSGDGRRRIVRGERGYSGGIAAAPGGRVLVTFTRATSTDDQIAVARLEPGGRLDRTFGSKGLALIGSGSTRESGGGVGVTRDRRILIVGGFNDGTDDDRLLVRLLGDTRAPGTRITAGPRGSVEPGMYRIRFRGLRDTGLRFECRLKRPGAAAKFAPCRSPRRVRVRAGREYGFSVRATDPAGNVDPTPAATSFRGG